MAQEASKINAETAPSAPKVRPAQIPPPEDALTLCCPTSTMNRSAKPSRSPWSRVLRTSTWSVELPKLPDGPALGAGWRWSSGGPAGVRQGCRLADRALSDRQSQLPNLTDMSSETITENVHAINSLCQNERSGTGHPTVIDLSTPEAALTPSSATGKSSFSRSL